MSGPEVHIRINDETRAMAPGVTCQQVLVELTGQQIGPDGSVPGEGGLAVAIAVDGEVVPRGRWSCTVLRDGARVEIVGAVQGG